MLLLEIQAQWRILDWFAISALLYLVITHFVLPHFSNEQIYLKKTPWVGLKREWFSQLRGGIRFVKESRRMLDEGYAKVSYVVGFPPRSDHRQYNKKGKTFVLPQMIHPVVVVPGNKLNEYINLPDEEIDPHIVNREQISGDYTLPLADGDDMHMDIVRRQLTRKLPILTSSVYQELVLAMQEIWKANEISWTSANVYPTCMRIVSRAANRVFGGAELCRNHDFIESSREYTVAVFTAGALIRLFPRLLQPMVAPLIVWRAGVQKHHDVCVKVAGPIISSRIKNLRNPPDNYEAPVDALQWLIEDCLELSKEDPSQIDPVRISSRLLMMNMVAIHTTSMVTTNTILDLYNSPQKDEYVAGIREEVARVLREGGGTWTKQGVDSAIKESMRVTPLNVSQIRRTVMSPNGLTLSGDIHLPHGTRLVTAAHALHTDYDTYGPSAKDYDAFRFSRPKEKESSLTDSSGDRLTDILDQRNSALIATSDKFIAFGHGRHACPGRFFASQEMKLFIAHLVTHYDVRIKGELAPPLQLNGSYIPSDAAEIELRLLSKPIEAA